MNKFFICCVLAGACFVAKAQTPSGPAHPTEEYGKVNQADLDLKTCDFEKDANAEVLFDKGSMYEDGTVTILERHTRIKILNDFGKNAANARLEYVSSFNRQAITDLQAETINLENGKIEITPLDKKQIYTEKVDKNYSALAFAFPAVKAGSIIEYKYRYALTNGYFPSWYFQNRFPTRYSEIKLNMPPSSAGKTVRVIPHVKQDYTVNIGGPGDYVQVKALTNVRSLPDEPYMSSRADNLQRMEYFGITTALDSWKKIGDLFIRFDDFGGQYDRGLSNESAIIKQAKALKTDDEKIAFIFNTVKNTVKWNDISHFYTDEGMQNAWDKKTGNSAEINMMVYHLLKKSGVKAYPMIVSTKKMGHLNPFYPNVYLFQNTVVYIPVDSTKNYVLDATNKYNLYNTIPDDQLNTFGLNIDEDNKEYKTVFLESTNPIMQSVFLNAEIKPNGKMTGTADLTSTAYNKMVDAKLYKTDGEEKYISYLTNKDNNVKVSSLKLEGMDVDSIPLTQHVIFNADLTGSDETYLYFNTNLFSQMGANPFINETRFSDVDFGYRDNYAISGMYKMPAGYALSALPKSTSIVIPDGSITFKRLVSEGDGMISVRYVLNHKKTIYYNQDYAALRAFYKQMYDLLNEQIVLKKS